MSEQKDEDLVHVVNRTALIENLLNQVIELHCEPASNRAEFFWSVILDSSVMPLGSKVKVVAAIASELDVKFDREPLHDILSLRNAFAHHQTDSHPMLKVGKDGAEDEFFFQLKILKNNGKLESKSRQVGRQKFDTAFTQAKASLVTLKEEILSKW